MKRDFAESTFTCIDALQTCESFSSEEAEEAVGKLWSAQYMAPGTLCAFAGAQLADTLSSSMKSSIYTHAVRFRFGDMKVSIPCHGWNSIKESLIDV